MSLLSPGFSGGFFTTVPSKGPGQSQQSYCLNVTPSSEPIFFLLTKKKKKERKKEMLSLILSSYKDPGRTSLLSQVLGQGRGRKNDVGKSLKKPLDNNM